MPSFTNNYTEPGTYVVINDDIVTDVNTGLLSVCIIGTGKTTKNVNNELLELLPPIDESVVDLALNVTYTQGTVLKYNTSYYRVETAGSISYPEVIPGSTFSIGDVLMYDMSYYEVTTDNTSIPTAIEAAVDGTYAQGDILVTDPGLETAKYYQVNTAGTATSPLSEWLNSNAEEITSSQADSILVARWLPENTTPIESQEEADSKLISNWLSANATETTIGYPDWTPATDYVVGNLMTYDNSYYRCIVSHTSPEEITSSYLNSNWISVSPIATYYSAQLQDNIINAPRVAVDAISSKEYRNSDEVVYFEISGDTFIWKAPVVNGTAVMPQISADGKYSVTVGYTVEKTSSDREAKSYTRLSSIFAAYGEPSAENTISAGAQVAYDNGATAFYCIQPEVNQVTGNIDAAGLQSALREASKVNTYCILPMVSPYTVYDGTTKDTTNSLEMSQIISACKTHVENMSTTLERKERIVVLSDKLSIETNDDIDGAIANYKSNAASANSPRVIYITPSLVTVTLDSGTVAQANGMYAAAALAGIICNNNYTCGEPISGKTLADVTINDRYTREEKNILASYGCLVLEGAEGTSVAKIRHALSTATGDLVKSEIKITKIKDVISNTLRLALDRAYINTRFTGASTISEMTATVNTILSSFLANNDIVSYNNLVIAQDLNYPNQVNVSFRIQPTVDVNYILVTFGVSFQG